MELSFLGPKPINSSKELATKFPGIVLQKDSAIKVWEGKYRKIKLPKKYRKVLGKNLYYMDKKHCYGILKIGKFLEEDNYKIEILDKFEAPKPVVPSNSPLVEDIKFLQATQEKVSEVQLMEPYTPQKPLDQTFNDLDKFIRALT